MTRIGLRRRIALASLLFLIPLAAVASLVAWGGWLGRDAHTAILDAWRHLNEFADSWYTWLDKMGKLVGLFVTLGSGAYAIYHRWHFAESNMHLRLREFQQRVERRLTDARRHIEKALVRPSPAQPFDAPIFIDETLGPALRAMNWGRRPKADQSLEQTLAELEQQLNVWDAQKGEYQKRKAQACLLRGAIAASRAAKTAKAGKDARPDNLEALGFFQQAYALDPGDAEALEYIGHQQARLGDCQAAIEQFQQLVNLAPADGQSLLRARALRFQAEVHENKPHPNLNEANRLLIQAVPALPQDARLLERGEMHEVHGRVREKARFDNASQSYTQAEIFYQRIVDGSNSELADLAAAREGLVRVRAALQRIRLQPLAAIVANGSAGLG